MRKFLPLTIIFALLGFFLFFAVVSFARVDKIIWCHTEPNGNQQTLELPEQALNGHIDAQGNILHAGDHYGACEESESTPTPFLTPTLVVEPSVTPSATPTKAPEPKDSPEKSDPCYYIHNNPGCLTRQEVFPDEGEKFGPSK